MCTVYTVVPFKNCVSSYNILSIPTFYFLFLKEIRYVIPILCIYIPIYNLEYMYNVTLQLNLELIRFDENVVARE